MPFDNIVSIEHQKKCFESEGGSALRRNQVFGLCAFVSSSTVGEIATDDLNALIGGALSLATSSLNKSFRLDSDFQAPSGQFRLTTVRY